MRLSFKINEGQAQGIISELGRFHAGFIPLVARTMGDWAQDTAGWIRESELSGQVLHRRSGNLASSIVATPPRVQGTVIKVQIQPGFGDVPIVYARIHELGGIITATQFR